MLKEVDKLISKYAEHISKNIDTRRSATNDVVEDTKALAALITARAQMN